MRVVTLALLLLTLPAAAQDLQQVYRDAKAYDAQYASARYALQAGLEKLPQGRALLLPTLNATAGTTTNHLSIDPYGPNPTPPSARTFYNRNYLLSLSQPLFRPQNWLQYDQAEQQVRQSEAVFGQAGQDLIVRVAQAYFDVLAAQDTYPSLAPRRRPSASNWRRRSAISRSARPRLPIRTRRRRVSTFRSPRKYRRRTTWTTRKRRCLRSSARNTPPCARCARRSRCRRPIPTAWATGSRSRRSRPMP